MRPSLLFTKSRPRNKTGAFVSVPVKERFLKFVNKSGSCWTWIGAIHYKGYGEFIWEKGEKTKAHRAAYRLFKGEIPDGMMVCHRCDNPPCVTPDHLFLGTGLDNNRDRMIKGRNGYRRKVTDADVVRIRELFAKGEYNKEQIGQMFNISGRQIGSIVRYESWPALR